MNQPGSGFGPEDRMGPQDRPPVWRAGPPPAEEYGQMLLSIGDIAVTQTHVLVPAGAFPLVGTTWLVQENVYTTESIPTWAIVLTVIFFLFCLLGLLFLLAKERKTQGYVQVSVQGRGFFHATQVPVHNQWQVGHLHQQVNYVRGLVAASGGGAH